MRRREDQEEHFLETREEIRVEEDLPSGVRLQEAEGESRPGAHQCSMLVDETGDARAHASNSAFSPMTRFQSSS